MSADIAGTTRVPWTRGAGLGLAAGLLSWWIVFFLGAIAFVQANEHVVRLGLGLVLVWVAIGVTVALAPGRRRAYGAGWAASGLIAPTLAVAFLAFAIPG